MDVCNTITTEERIKKDGWRIYPKGNPATNNFAYKVKRNVFCVYNLVTQKVYKCPVPGLELNTIHLRTLRDKGPSAVDQMFSGKRKRKAKTVFSPKRDSPKKKRHGLQQDPPVTIDLQHILTKIEWNKKKQKAKRLEEKKEEQKKQKENRKWRRGLQKQVKKEEQKRQKENREWRRGLQRQITDLSKKLRQIKKAEEKRQRQITDLSKKLIKLTEIVASTEGPVIAGATEGPVIADTPISEISIENPIRPPNSHKQTESVQIRTENKTIFQSILFGGIIHAITAGMRVTNEYTGGASLSKRTKLIHFSTYDATLVIYEIFKELLPAGDYLVNNLPEKIKLGVPETVWMETDDEMVIVEGEKKAKVIEECLPGTIIVSLDTRQYVSISYGIAQGKKVSVKIEFFRRCQIPNRRGDGWREMGD
jgi:hypothetical protein